MDIWSSAKSSGFSNLDKHPPRGLFTVYKFSERKNFQITGKSVLPDRGFQMISTRAKYLVLFGRTIWLLNRKDAKPQNCAKVLCAPLRLRVLAVKHSWLRFLLFLFFLYIEIQPGNQRKEHGIEKTV